VKTITVPPAVQQELETGRQVARTLQLRITGTLGILIDAKRLGIISAVGPFLDQLQSFGFRLAPHTRAAVLNLVSEVEK